MKMGILPVRPRRLYVYALTMCVLSLWTSLGLIVSKKEPIVYAGIIVIYGEVQFYDIIGLDVF